MILLLLLLTLPAFGVSSPAKNLYEKTFGRDNSFCYGKNGRLEILIRGDAKYTEITERGFGEYIFTRTEDGKINVLDLNNERSHTYKFFSGHGPICSKGMAFKLDGTTLAVLFMRENKPFKEKLVIQLFDYNSMNPKNFIETDYNTDKAKKYKDGFIFNSFGERLESEIGKVTIDGTSYTYQDRDFPKWISYSLKGFETSPDYTYENFPYKKAFKNQQDFLNVSGWDPTKKEFTNNYIYIAVNHAQKKGCIIFVSKKKKPDGSEPWRCQTM